MRVVVVHAHPDPESFSRALCDVAVATLRRSHSVELFDLYADGFDARLTTEERIAYETDTPILDAYVARSAAAVKAADALLFVYPTWWFGAPAVMKGWLERVFVPGVGFSLDPKTNKVKSGLRSIRRVGAVTTYGSPKRNIFAMADGGKRLVNRCVRAMCSVRCRTTWLGLYGVDAGEQAQRKEFLLRVDRKLSSW
jgi:NAD(P)H dehydrogenase (quinone)